MYDNDIFISPIMANLFNKNLIIKRYYSNDYNNYITYFKNKGL